MSDAGKEPRMRLLGPGHVFATVIKAVLKAWPGPRGVFDMR